MLNRPFAMTINGAPVSGAQSYDVINPATARVFAQAPDCSSEELDLAIAGARAAFSGWARTPVDDRRRLISDFAAAIVENVGELAQLLTMEQGKPLKEANDEIMAGAHWLLETAKLDIPETVSEDSDERRTVTVHEPLGVVAGIVPWNFPVMLAMCKVAPALLAGNAMILKPAPTTPLTSLRIGELARDILPAGVFSVISGNDQVGPWLTVHPDISKVSFTGSTATGKKVMQSAASTLKRVTLELGGNDACIVMPGIDVEAVAQWVFWGSFTNAGQVCICTKRLYVHKDVYQPLMSALVSYAGNITIGDGAAEGTLMGPLQNQTQYQRVIGLLNDARDRGYTFVAGGEVPESPGYFLPISILDNPPEDSRVVQEEQFGPILPLLKFDTADEVVDRVNASEYGLGAVIWAGDEAEASAIARRLDVGSVWVNEIQHLSPHASFGGHKQSGIGVECGLDGLLEYTVAKTIYSAKAQ